ncbi:FHA domain-containing protein OS=Streptomyces tendae OX=1932 GN=F3L20_12640 PE=4 SV=1 [Streptomyces tendae]
MRVRDVVFQFNTYPARLSDAERDRVLKVLRDGVAMGRLSHDTFIRRMELALAARRSDETGAAPHRRPARGAASRASSSAASRRSPGFTVRLRRAWQADELPKLLLHTPVPNRSCA